MLAIVVEEGEESCVVGSEARKMFTTEDTERTEKNLRSFSAFSVPPWQMFTDRG